MADKLCVLIAPELFTLAISKSKVVMSSVPPEVVVRVPLTVKAPPAVLVALELLRVRLLYVPDTMVWAPEAAEYIIVPPHVLPDGIGTALVTVGTAVLIVPLLVIVDNVPPRVLGRCHVKSAACGGG